MATTRANTAANPVVTARKPVVAICTPFLHRLGAPYMAAMEASGLALEAAGWTHHACLRKGNAYISAARAELLREALDLKPDCIVYIDYDLSWRPADLLALIRTDGDVVGGVYRFKKPDIEYMGTPELSPDGHTKRRHDGCIRMFNLPAGFLKIAPAVVNRFAKAYPDLIYGDHYYPFVDLFNHGAIDRVWHGEDYAFCKRWRDIGGELWCRPDMDLVHHLPAENPSEPTEAFPGNFHRWLCERPGGSHDPNRLKANAAIAAAGGMDAIVENVTTFAAGLRVSQVKPAARAA